MGSPFWQAAEQHIQETLQSSLPFNFGGSNRKYAPKFKCIIICQYTIKLMKNLI